MSKIYTKTGDRGQTSLMDGSRVPKSHIRVETYGTIDELNAVLGVTISELRNKNYESKIKKELLSIQNDLFEIGSRLSNPSVAIEKKFISYLENRIQEFEKEIDDMTEKLPVLTNFILPGGGRAGAQLHITRTVVRRVERRIIALSQEEKVEEMFIKYFNRLSDLFFTMSRFVNFTEKKNETIWVKRV